MNEVLKVTDLSVSFGEKKVVKDVSFSLEKGKILGIVGESGSGKTMTGLSIMGLLPEEATVSGKVFFDENNLIEMNINDRRKINGKHISMIFQEPMTSLNPLMKVGKQLEEMLTLHEKTSKGEKKKRVLSVLEEVDLSNPEKIYNSYPHKLSGGMRQRVMIAMALILNPQIMIADEPTTALDKGVEEEIIRLLLKLNKEKQVSIIFVSHDLEIVKNISDYVLVMKNGEILEQNGKKELFAAPKHPYTVKLIESMSKGIKETTEIHNECILEVKDVSLYYKGKKDKQYIANNINFVMKKGEILGIQGKSGCGKSTLARAILGLHNGYDGEIICKEKKHQMVFQDPYGSLNPVKKIGWILSEILRIDNAKKGGERLSKEQIHEKAAKMIERVGLSEEYLDRYPRELSGGQRQRVSIAVALIAGSRFIIADEPVSALDVTIQNQILELLVELQKEFKLSILFISHDPNVMKAVCDRVIRYEDIMG